VRDASLSVRAGEIVCLAGLIGSGRSELCEAVFGVHRYTGTVRLEGKDVRFLHPSQAMRAGIGMVPEDRKEAGLFLEMSVMTNISAANLEAISPGGIVSEAKNRALAQSFVEKLRIMTPSVHKTVGGLSGGNQQKVLLSKWLSRSPRLLIVDEPTRGVDVGARAEIYRILRELAGQGVGLLVVSSDLPEVLSLADRIVVMNEGRTVGELEGATATELDILNLAAQHGASSNPSSRMGDHA
jgi:ribose transport system ATP-binding protein/rhamnose transport system ATP-binding protein